jgi:hypothetical protein
MRRLLAFIAVCLLAAPAVAHASGQAVIRDCTDDGRIEGHYKQKDYRDALAHLPTDVDEYTDCRDVIRRAQLSGAAGGGGGGGPAGGTSGTTSGGVVGANPLATATPAERRAVAHSLAHGGAPLNVGGHLIRPGTLGFAALGSPATIPTPLLVVLVLLALGVLGGAGVAIRNRVLARRAR